VKRSLALLVLLGCGLAAPVSAAAARRTRITSMHLSEKRFTDAHGATRLRVIVRVRALRTTRAQPAACHTHRIAWTPQDKFLGVGRYRVSVRAKTSHRGWSHAAARHATRSTEL
jgi:hypothetical protein